MAFMGSFVRINANMWKLPETWPKLAITAFIFILMVLFLLFFPPPSPQNMKKN